MEMFFKIAFKEEHKFLPFLPVLPDSAGFSTEVEELTSSRSITSWVVEAIEVRLDFFTGGCSLSDKVLFLTCDLGADLEFDSSGFRLIQVEQKY